MVAIIDEDPWTVRAASAVLLEAGFRVMGFSSPEIAAANIMGPANGMPGAPAVKKFDVVVTEHHMRELLGARLCAGAKEAMGEDCPAFLLLTRSLDTVPASDRAEFEEVLTKPLDREVLLAAIGRALERRSIPMPTPPKPRER
jgi:CheY-like chemotaxis protein